MKLYDTPYNALQALQKEGKTYLPRICPYADDTIERMCGNWCPHFRATKTDAVILTCGSNEITYRLGV